MATVSRWPLFVLVSSACGDLEGFGGPTPPLVSFRIETTGDFETVRQDDTAPQLHAALVWTEQWVPQPFCRSLPVSDEAAEVALAGCRDPLGAAPDRVAASIALTLDGPTQLDLFSLPAADVMVGDITARIAYGTIVIYDDRDRDGTLRLRSPRRFVNEPQAPGDDEMMSSEDVVYGTSFLTMQEPDQRIAFREGAYLALSAFYPRFGCGEPPLGFSVLSAGGFTLEDAIAAQLAGRLPEIDAATCAEQAPKDAVVSVALRPPSEVNAITCTVQREDGSVRYRNPVNADTNELAGRAMACIPMLDDNGAPTGTLELVVSSRADEPCKEVFHFLLAGCRGGLDCVDENDPDDRWDNTASPPSWWPCG